MGELWPTLLCKFFLYSVTSKGQSIWIRFKFRLYNSGCSKTFCFVSLSHPEQDLMVCSGSLPCVITQVHLSLKVTNRWLGILTQDFLVESRISVSGVFLKIKLFPKIINDWNPKKASKNSTVSLADLFECMLYHEALKSRQHLWTGTENGCWNNMTHL